MIGGDDGDDEDDGGNGGGGGGGDGGVMVIMMVLGDPSSMRLGIGGSEVRAACKQCFRLPFRHGSLGECTTQDDRSHGMWIEYVKCLERRCEGKHRKGLAL